MAFFSLPRMGSNLVVEVHYRVSVKSTVSFKRFQITKPEAAPLPDPVIAEPETHPAAVIRISQMQIELFPTASADMIREIMRAASHV